jgi:hypothetical protein
VKLRSWLEGGVLYQQQSAAIVRPTLDQDFCFRAKADAQENGGYFSSHSRIYTKKELVTRSFTNNHAI